MYYFRFINNMIIICQELIELTQDLMGRCVNLLTLLANKNNYVQTYLFDRLEPILHIEGCGRQQATLIMQVGRVLKKKK